jgi:cobalt-zinc-cadmium resistance protein CzcA
MDLETVVENVQKLIVENISLPPDYTISYGGQFANLRSAKSRLMVAVPVALLLILILLHFAFRSIKEALMIFSASPLSAIGGVLLLWIRDLPFSISAGVGFIALFGIAVLNGIVLIEHFKTLKKEGMNNVKQRVLIGTVQRLRPVLLTASAAALGFLPMAISTSAGAEVQRPLATVVIGGLVSATLLTLVVLPVLYTIFDSRKISVKLRPKMMSLFLFLLPALSYAQPAHLTLEEVITMAKSNNAALGSSRLAILEGEALIGTAFDFDKTKFYFNYNHNNITPENQQLNVWGIQQSLHFPTIYSAQQKLRQNQVRLLEHQYNLNETALVKEVSLAHNQIIFLMQLQKNYEYLDSIYNDFANYANRKFDLGESNLLEKLTAESRKNQINLQRKQVGNELESTHAHLGQLLQAGDTVQVQHVPFEVLTIALPDTSNHPGVQYYSEAINLANQATRLEKNKFLPDLSIQYFQGSGGATSKTYRGFEIGIGIPLLYGNNKAMLHSSKIAKERRQLEAESYKTNLKYGLAELMANLAKQKEALKTYDESGKRLSEEILHAATGSFQSGEIDFFQYILLIDQAISIEVNYLLSKKMYNETVLEINYFIN